MKAITLLLLSLGTAAVLGVRAQEPFAEDVVPSITFTDSYREVVQATTADGMTSREVVPDPEGSRLRIFARLSTSGIDLDAIDGDTPFDLELGVFTFSATLADALDYTPGATAVHFALLATDPDTGDDVQVGSVALSWANGVLTVAVSAIATGDYSIDALNNAGQEGPIAGTMAVTLLFADHLVDCRTIYETGDSSVTTRWYGSGDDAEELDTSSVHTAGSIDTTPPRVTIDSPTRANSVTAEPLTFSGTVTDNGELNDVLVVIDGDEPVSASFGDGTWSYGPLLLKPGTHRAAVSAVDEDGNSSTPIERTWTVPAPLVVTVAGSGSITRGYLGTTLQVPGDNLAVRAVPASGWLFDGWTGSFASDSATIQFRMAEGCVLQANFIPNPFPSIKGSYLGVIQPGAGFDQGGLFNATITGTGSLSAQLIIGTVKRTIIGQLTHDGRIATSWALADGSRLTATIQVDVANGSDALQLVVSDGLHEVRASADRNVFSASRPTPRAGSYTALLLATDGAALPQGDGFATLTVTGSGRATFTGVLGDGTALSYAGVVSKGGTVPVYVTPYAKGGTLAGVLSFHSVPGVGDLEGVLSWSKAPAAGEVYYPEGFAGPVTVTGSRYVPPRPGHPALELTGGSGNLLVMISGDALSDGLEQNVATWSSVGTVQVAAPNLNKLALKFKPGCGLFSGSFRDPNTNVPRTFQGALQQAQNLGAGTFRGSVHAGSVRVTAH